jgi:hypothetical protein
MEANIKVTSTKAREKAGANISINKAAITKDNGKMI